MLIPWVVELSVAMYGSTIVNGNFSNITIEAKTNYGWCWVLLLRMWEGLLECLGNGDGGISNFIIDSVKVVSQNVDNNGQKVDSSSEICYWRSFGAYWNWKY